VSDSAYQAQAGGSTNNSRIVEFFFFWTWTVLFAWMLYDVMLSMASLGVLDLAYPTQAGRSTNNSRIV
jgi:hypothetical protein